MLVDLRRRLHVQLAPDGLLGKGLHGINCTILGKHLTICVRHIFGIGCHELGVGGRDLSSGRLCRGKVCLIRLQRIYNFLLFHAIILHILDVYGLYFTLLYHFWD